MPYIAPSHQAPALLLKRWRPGWFSGLGLVIGTMAPDLEFILRLQDDWVVSHTLAAQLYFTAPLTVVLYWLSVELVLPWLIPFLPSGAPLHLEGLAAIRRPRRVPWVTVAFSGSIGGLTHIFIDGFTHGNHSGWAVALLPFLRWPIPGVGLPIHDALQIVLSVGLGMATVALWRQSVAAAPIPAMASTPRPPEARSRLAGSLVIAAAAGVALARHVHPGAAGIGALALDAYGAVDCAGLVVLAGAVWDRLRGAETEARAVLGGA
jgi:Domain of unknown function (DUF4184)